MTSPTSSSLHTYNADKGLGFFEKFLYLFLNWLNNSFPYTNLDRRISIRPATLDHYDRYWPKTHPHSSAARKLSDLFWWTLPWNEIKSELGDLNVFDTGCGSGVYGVRINDASGGVKSYTGIDAKEKAHWQELMETHSNFKLIKSNSSSISELIPQETNLFITQSAIEHFDEDLRFFEQIRTFIEHHPGRPIMQIHVFPAAATLPLYLFHGLRQYTPRTISNITRLFDESADISLMGLGGRQSKKLHFKYFTWPILYLRQKGKWEEDPDQYGKNLHAAIESDLKTGDPSPLFWALVIRSGIKK